MTHDFVEKKQIIDEFKLTEQKIRMKRRIKMENWGMCKKYRYVDPTERSGYKWYCSWYKCYVDPDTILDCPHYYESNSS